MSLLSGLTLSEHLDSLFTLPDCNTIYGYPNRKIFRGFKGYDFSVKLFGKSAATPMGPAAGPHTQLAQNILLAYLAGSRIIELKTIQILDQLHIPKPCIDIRNIGFNVEWSQELSLNASFQEYMNAWILLHILKEKKILGGLFETSFYDFIFDVSVGYDLKGIQSEPVKSWLKKIKYAEIYIADTLNNLPEKYQFLKATKIPSNISDSVTLSTFHGCPADEIEKIVQFLIEEQQLNVIIKLNPTLLGYNFVNDLLTHKLGYKNIILDKAEFENDLSFDKAIEITERLNKFAKIHKRSIGVKFTNTLVVKNNERIFDEPVRYLSGAPLYVLAMHTMHQFREHIGWDIPVSFSGGINQNNFTDALACNMIPVTVCTDILKKGGYGRFYNYLAALRNAMEHYQVNTLEKFILHRANLNEKEQKHKAGRTNSQNIIKNIDNDTRYHWISNQQRPKSMPSRLKLFDCISCKICIPVCPNSAIFYFNSKQVIENFFDYKYDNGSFVLNNKHTYNVAKKIQIGIINEFCNDCGNCQTHCPETGAPFKDKPHFFIRIKNYKSQNNQDGFHFASNNQLYARINGIETKLTYKLNERIYIWETKYFVIRFDENNKLIKHKIKEEKSLTETVDTATFIIMKIIMNSFINFRQSFPIYLY